MQCKAKRTWYIHFFTDNPAVKMDSSFTYSHYIDIYYMNIQVCPGYVYIHVYTKTMMLFLQVPYYLSFTLFHYMYIHLTLFQYVHLHVDKLGFIIHYQSYLVAHC